MTKLALSGILCGCLVTITFTGSCAGAQAQLSAAETSRLQGLVAELEEVAMCHHALRVAGHEGLSLNQSPYYRYIINSPHKGSTVTILPMPDRCKNIETKWMSQYSDADAKGKTNFDQDFASLGMTADDIAADARFMTQVISYRDAGDWDKLNTVDSSHEKTHTTPGAMATAPTLSTGEIVTTDMTDSAQDSEAKAEAMKVIDGMLTKCGDKYYIYNDIGWNHNEFIEFRDKPSFLMGSGFVSDMDRLNGLAWHGAAGISASSAERVLKHDEIGPWQKGPAHGFDLRKIHDVWEFSQTWREGPEKDGQTLIDGFKYPVPCEKVSEYLGQKAP